MALEHVALNVPEPAAMAAWYCENLNMRLVVANDESPFIHFVTDDAGSMLEFYNNPLAPLPDYAQIHPLNLHLAFATEDITAARARLIQAGAAVVDEIATNAAGDQLAFLRDPWQVPVQLVQRAKPLA